MNKNKNLYKLDDFFIIISYLLILPLLYIFRPMISYAIYNKEGIQEILLQFVRSQSVLISILVGSIIFLQILGRLIRKEEKILVKILDTVVMYKTISINQLHHNLDMSQPQIEKYIKKLSNIGRLNIHYDGTYVKLQLNTGTDEINRAPTASAQGYSSDFRSVSPEQEPASEYRSVPPAHEPSYNSQSQGDNSTDAIYRVSPTANGENTTTSKEEIQNILGQLQGKGETRKKFNVILFIVLFFAFWPIAFIYAASYYMKSQKGSVIEDRLKNRLKDM